MTTSAAVNGPSVRRLPVPALRLDTPEGFRAFYDASLPELFRYLMRRCDGDRALAEDLTQEVFLAAARLVRDGRADTLSMGWLISVAQNRHVDQLRRRQRDERNLAVAWQVGEHDDLRRWRMQSDRAHARELVQDLPVAQRLALELFYFHDLTVGQAADRLGRSVRATESLLARGRATLRAKLAEEAHDA